MYSISGVTSSFYIADLATRGANGEQRLLDLYAAFRGWLNVGVLGIQLMGTSRLFRRVGIRSRRRCRRSSMLGFFGLGVRLDLPAGIGAVAGANLQDHAIYEPAQKMLVTLFPEPVRSTAIAAIEGPVRRLGGAVGNLLIIVALAFGVRGFRIGFAGLPIAAVWLVLTVVLWRIYPTLLLELATERRRDSDRAGAARAGERGRTLAYRPPPGEPAARALSGRLRSSLRRPARARRAGARPRAPARARRAPAGTRRHAPPDSRSWRRRRPSAATLRRRGESAASRPRAAGCPRSRPSGRRLRLPRGAVSVGRRGPRYSRRSSPIRRSGAARGHRPAPAGRSLRRPPMRRRCGPGGVARERRCRCSRDRDRRASRRVADRARHPRRAPTPGGAPRRTARSSARSRGRSPRRSPTSPRGAGRDGAAGGASPDTRRRSRSPRARRGSAVRRAGAARACRRTGSSSGWRRPTIARPPRRADALRALGSKAMGRWCRRCRAAPSGTTRNAVLARLREMPVDDRDAAGTFSTARSRRSGVERPSSARARARPGLRPGSPAHPRAGRRERAHRAPPARRARARGAHRQPRAALGAVGRRSAHGRCCSRPSDAILPPCGEGPADPAPRRYSSDARPRRRPARSPVVRRCAPRHARLPGRAHAHFPGRDPRLGDAGSRRRSASVPAAGGRRPGGSGR